MPDRLPAVVTASEPNIDHVTLHMCESGSAEQPEGREATQRGGAVLCVLCSSLPSDLLLGFSPLALTAHLMPRHCAARQSQQAGHALLIASATRTPLASAVRTACQGSSRVSAAPERAATRQAAGVATAAYPKWVCNLGLS